MLGLLLVLALSNTPRAEVPPALRELLSSGRLREACTGLEEALAAEPGNRALREALVEACMQLGRYSAALEFAAPLGEEANRTRGLALYLTGRYAEAVELLPEDAETILYRHESLRALARHEAARACLARAAELLGEDHPEVLVRRAQELVRGGEHAAAIPLFERALARDPLAAPAQFGLGRALVRTGKREAGLELLERHRALLPLLDARDFARQNLALDRTHAPSHAELAESLRALAPYDASQLAHAAEAYAQASRFARGSEVAPVALRRARFEEEAREDPDAAVRILHAAHETHPDVRLLVRAGDVRLRTDDAVAALVEYEAARALRPADAAIEQRILAARAAREAQR